MTSSRVAVCGRIPLATSLLLVALVLSVLASAGTAYAATHIPTTTYSSNTTWTLANSPYVLDGNVTVAAGATLTIEAGVIVKFNGASRELRINGTLAAVGTSANHIVFTSYQDDTAAGDTNGDGTATAGQPGQWSNVNVTSGNAGSQIRYADVRYGAFGSANEAYGALRVGIAGTSVTVEDSTFTNNQRSGIYVNGQSTNGVIVRRTTLANNGNGISVNQGWAKVEDNSSIRNNSEDGAWFNLTSTFTGSQSYIKDSEARDNTRDGVRLIVNAGLDLGRWPTGFRNNIYGNGGKQLYTLNTKRTADWKNNYWGQSLYFPVNQGVCLGAGQDSRGKIAYTGSQTSPPDGPISAAFYSAGGQVCAYDKIAIEKTEFQTFPFRGSGGMPESQSLGDGFAEDTSAVMGDPVNSASGSSMSSATDLKLPGVGMTFAFTRSYNGIDASAGPLGRGWTHSYNASLAVKAGGDVTARAGSGQLLEFAKNADGSFTAAAGGRATLTSIQGGYELATSDQLHYGFDTVGKLTSLKDRNAQGLSFAYDGNGRLTTITDAAGRQITLSYDGSGLLTQVAIPGGRSVSYGYTFGRLTSVTDARGKVWTYTYEQYGLLEKLIDPLNHTVFRNVYGSGGRLIEQYDALNRKTSFAWDPATQTQTATDARGKVWKDVYSNGRLVQQIDPLNNTTSYGYDSDLNLTSVTDPRGKQTTMTYDTKGNLLTRTAPAPLSYQEVFTYNSLNDVATARDGRGNTTSFGYDSAGNLTSVTRPGSNVTQYGRDASGNGLLRTVTDPRGKVTNLDYDSAGNLTAITTPLGNKTTMAYDTSGRMTSRVDPRGNVTGADPNDYRTTYTYNANDQPLTVTNPLGHVTTYAYDDAGKVTSVTDPRSHATTFAYNAVDKLTTVTAEGGAATAYAYDAVNNLTSRTDPNNHQTTYAYDDASRLTSATNPLNKTWSLSYDASGNRTVVTKPSGGTVTVAYDAINRPTAVDFSDATADVTYSYDGSSNRTQMTDGAGTQTYSYDALNRLTGVTRGMDSFTYAFDGAGNITLRTYPDGASISSSYDDDSRLASVTRSGNTANYSYNPAGSPIQTTLPNSYIESRSYDRAGRVTQIKHSTGASVLSQFDYAYDAVGNPISVTTPGGVSTYGYDVRDRLTSVCFQASCPGGSDPFIRWTYDPVGNRLTEARPSGTTSYTYDAADQLTQAGSTAYAYDVNGNQTQAGSRTFGWNLAGQLVSTTAAGSTTNYGYDGDGNRLQAASSSQTTNYLWDVNAGLPRLAVERDGVGSALRSYAYGLNLLSMLSGGQHYYFHPDLVGSIRNVTSSSGQTEWTYSYEPFGSAQTETKNDPVAPDNPNRFAGELLDTDTGLYDLRARMYDPASGRFLSLDPRPAGQQDPYEGSYVYALNNPVGWIDPSGLGAVWPDGEARRSVVLDHIRGLLAKLKNGFCATSKLIGMAADALSPALFGHWLSGFLMACNKHVQRLINTIGSVGDQIANWISNHKADIVSFAIGCAAGVFAERQDTEFAIRSGHAFLNRLKRAGRFVASRSAFLMGGPWTAATACVFGGAVGFGGKQLIWGPG